MKAERIQPTAWNARPAPPPAPPAAPPARCRTYRPPPAWTWTDGPIDLPRRRPAPVSECGVLAQVVAVVMNATDTNFDDLASSSKLPRHVLARGMISLLAREYSPGSSYPLIARAMGKRGHTTVLAAERRMRAMVEAPEADQVVINWGGTEARVATLYWFLAGQVEANLGSDAARRPRVSGRPVGVVVPKRAAV